MPAATPGLGSLYSLSPIEPMVASQDVVLRGVVRPSDAKAAGASLSLFRPELACSDGIATGSPLSSLLQVAAVPP